MALLPREVRRPETPPDPEQRMAGVCQTCRTPVAVERWQSRPAKDPVRHSMFAPWADLPTCECPKCGAVVPLSPAKPEEPDGPAQP